MNNVTEEVCAPLALNNTAALETRRVVQYNSTHCACPNCGNANPPSSAGRPHPDGKRIRYHYCACGARFKSFGK